VHGRRALSAFSFQHSASGETSLHYAKKSRIKNLGFSPDSAGEKWGSCGAQLKSPIEYVVNIDMNPTDEFTAYHAELLDGTYDCVDRIVLNAYFPLGSNPGG